MIGHPLLKKSGDRFIEFCGACILQGVTAFGSVFFNQPGSMIDIHRFLEISQCNWSLLEQFPGNFHGGIEDGGDIKGDIR